MAKKFGGFTPKQQQTLLSKVGYTGPAQQDDINKFMMASPKASSMMGKYAEIAKDRVSGGKPAGMAEGGITTSSPVVPLPTGVTTPSTTGVTTAFMPADTATLPAADTPALLPTDTPNVPPAYTPPLPTAYTTTSPTESIYDPSTGLPTMSESIKGLTKTPEELTFDPADVVAGRPGGFFRRDKASYIKLSDGTVLSTKSGSTAQEVEAVIKMAEDAVKERNLQIAEYGDYDEKLGQYKAYYSTQSNKALDDPRATLDAAQLELAQAENLVNTYTAQLSEMDAEDPRREELQRLIEEQQVNVTKARSSLSQATTDVERVSTPSVTEMRSDALTAPSALVTKADVVKTTAEQRKAGKIASGTGQAPTTADVAAVSTAAPSVGIVAPTAKAAGVYDATTITQSAKDELDEVSAVEGDLSKGSKLKGEEDTVSPEAQASEINKVAKERIDLVNETVNIAVTKDQLAEAKGKTLKAIQANIAQSDALREAVAATSQVQPEELPPAALIAADQMAQAQAMTDAGVSAEANPVAAKLAKFSVDNGTLALAMEGDVKSLATVEGQLSQLMKDFNDGTPAWAAGAMRAANAAMASRGLGASSMASAAILQAAMESALPIAQQDANTFAEMGMQNLNNRQQVALSNAAAQQGLSLQNLSNEQQANLQRSSQAFALQTANLSNRQSAEIANAQIRATLQGKNLSNQQQSNISVAARYAEQANVNLNNKQQAAMQTNANQLQTNLANLSSKSQAYVTNANLAASLQGQVLTNEQQVSIQNAARFSDAANISFNAQQQSALHNSTMMQTIGLAELDANMAATLQNAATFAGMDMANLNNRQQAAVQNAKSFLELDLTNLTNEQQTAMFKVQALQQALLSDQAAENAAKQFNTASENQTNQFYDNLSGQISIQNQEQQNGINSFNAGQENAIAEFNSQQQNLRDQFNANNALVIEQANTMWEQAITTADNSAQNLINRDAALQANDFTESTYNAMLQEERDILDYVWRTMQSDLDRENSLLIAELQRKATADTAKGSAVGSLFSTAASFFLKKAFPG